MSARAPDRTSRGATAIFWGNPRSIWGTVLSLLGGSHDGDDDRDGNRAEAIAASRALGVERGAQRPFLPRRARLRGEDAITQRGVSEDSRHGGRPQPRTLRAAGRQRARRAHGAHVPFGVA